jgi:hypothetical protein
MYYLAMKICFFCGYVFKPDVEVFRSTKCDQCGKDVKICRNCKFYKQGVHWDCTETIDDPVMDKEASNFCSYFVYRDSRVTDEQKKPGTDTKKAFDKLFGNE